MPLFHTSRERWLWLAALGYTLLIYSTLVVAKQATIFLRERNLLRLTVGLAFGVVAVVAVVLLARLRLPGRAWLALLGIALGYAAVFPFAVAPEERLHLIEYGGLALLIFGALSERSRARVGAGGRPWPLRLRALVALLLTSLLGFGDELIQGLLPSRVYDLRDVAFNAAAAALALAAAGLLEWSRGVSGVR
ncbi:MAG TPA: hypothetical protein PK413_10345 [Thermoanaerobaculia bacterium]|nr:hypothetical protein [Thermoanaerobaculia bacterium]